MATTLRLSPEAAARVKEEAIRTRRSQQDVIRVAVDSYLGMDDDLPEALIDDRPHNTRRLRPPRVPYRASTDRLRLPEGLTSLDLLQREERL